MGLIIPDVATPEPATGTPRWPAAAVIPAAGRGKRFGSPENKIWARLGDRTVLERTLGAFQAHPGIDVIVIVAGEDEVTRVQEAARAFSKVEAVVPGGETRTDSVRKGLAALPPPIRLALVHDAARPLVTPEVISRVIEGAVRVGAAVPGCPLSDTVKRVDASGLVGATVARSETLGDRVISGLTAVQTPQGARVELLRKAYAHLDRAAGSATDEASLLEALGLPVAVVRGDPTNIKITHAEDLALAERFMENRETVPEVRTGLGYDVHAFAPAEAGRRLFLGGIEIAHDRGLEGHSDADVLLHAICDALLGAASLGDIGILFPNTDEAYRGISSLRLLEIVNERIRFAGWRIVNVDATVVAEAPKLMPHRAAMQQAMAHCLGLEKDRISVKATTSEKMGFVGRSEGIACWAIATVTRRTAHSESRIEDSAALALTGPYSRSE